MIIFVQLPYSVETKLINLAKSLARKMKTGHDWDSDYKVS